MNVGQAFLQYPEKSERHGLGKATRVLRQIYFHFNSATLRKSFQVPFCRRGKPDFVQKRRMQQMRNRPRFRDRMIQKLNCFSEPIHEKTDPRPGVYPPSVRESPD